ncbi:MAG: amino acid adenylation domain-containing protein [Catenulispora sp.]|nr:amino acid adenylation domain-containing protein [Catenulispora sp.]
MSAMIPRPLSAGRAISAAQERLWFLHRMDPDDASYNMYIVWRLRGPLIIERLEEAIGTVVARHEVLRTRYQDGEDGLAYPVVEPAGSFVLGSCDVSESSDPESAARALVAAQTNAPFDLAADLPLRGQLIRLAPEDHVLCLVVHHIAGDGWSLNILAEEVRRLYLGERLPAPSLQFSAVVEARQESSQPDYWPQRLRGAPPVELPCDRRPAPEDDLGAGSFHIVQLSPETVARLASAAVRSRSTLFMGLVAMYQTLLAVHSGQTDVVVGSVFAGRDRLEWEPVIGYLGVTVALRADLSGDPTVADLLVATRRSVLGAMDHPDVPFEELPDGMLQTLVVLHSQDVGTLGRSDDFGGLHCEDFPAGFARAKFDLMLEAAPDEGGLRLVLGYRTALFEPSTIVRLGERLALLAEEFADPTRRLSELRTLTADDVSVLTEWEHGSELADSGPATESSPDPESPAVECGETSVSHAELELQVERLAARLVSSGVGPGTVVGVRIPRSVGMVVAVLAVRRAGAAYLPLAVDDPEDRVRRLVADSGAALVLTSADPDDIDAGAGAGQSSVAAADLDDPACILYTSGSTGAPKGVVVTGRNLAARVAWMRSGYGLGPGDRVVQLAPLTFDTHVEEIYPTLAAGATLVLLPDGPLALPELLASPRGAAITVLDLPTAYWHQLVTMIDDITWPPKLRLVILGGEQAQGSAVAAWHARFGDTVRLVNTYGPTEATVIATACELRADDEASHARPPIGRPIGQTCVRVLDPAGRRVPPGAVGELCVGGGGVAHGYLNRPEQTAQRFIVDPYGSAGSRLYRTGDRARWRPDGRLEFLGRLDDQIKVRGIRIEPGEIEAALLGCPGVLQACVAVHDEALVGYLVAAPGLDPEHVRQRLAAELPAHLVPTAWVQLDALPLTATGKVDRAALPAPRPVADAEYQPPTGDAEQLVASVWNVVLRLEHIDRRDDFFALGGHSLSAMRVAARLTALIEVDVPVRLVFAHRTLAAQAAAVEALLIEALDALPDAAGDLVETEAS